jgi:hypothetical protein
MLNAIYKLITTQNTSSASLYANQAKYSARIVIIPANHMNVENAPDAIERLGIENENMLVTTAIVESTANKAANSVV